MITEEQLQENGHYYNSQAELGKLIQTPINGYIWVEPKEGKVTLSKSHFESIQLEGFDTIEKVNKLIAFLEA